MRTDLAPATWNVVTHATLNLGRLDQAGRQVPDPALLRRPTLRREAQATSALEGTFAPLADVLEIDPDDEPRPSRRSPQLTEVLNYVRAAEHGYATVVERGISIGLLSDLHRLLVANTPADGTLAGAVRDHQVVIGPERCRVREARFVPPPGGVDLEIALRQWIEWATKPSEVPALVRAAIGHYQFETLHPFNDGNGRIGRLLIILQLMQDHVLHEPLLTVSPWFETHRRDYQDQLEQLSATGDWDAWVRFFAEAVRIQADATADKVRQLIAFQESARAIMRDARRSGLVIDLIDDLVARPIISAGWVADAHGVSRQAAMTAIVRLVDAGILVETTGRDWGRVFACTRVVNIIEA